MRIVVGGVSQLYQGDLDLGRRAVERLRAEDLPPQVDIEDFHYGAVAVAQRLEELKPDSLLVVGAESRGRRPGSIERRRGDATDLSTEGAQAAVEGAVTGQVTIELMLQVANAFGELPTRTIVFEVEPHQIAPADQLSPIAEEALGKVVGKVVDEAWRTPLFELADGIRARLHSDRLEVTAAVRALQGLLDELAAVELRGRWGATFVLRDQLRQHIAAGNTGEGMDHLDWGQWWALVEELDRLQRLDVKTTAPG